MPTSQELKSENCFLTVQYNFYIDLHDHLPFSLLHMEKLFLSQKSTIYVWITVTATIKTPI